MITLADSIKDFAPAIALTKILSRKSMKRLRITFAVLLLIGVGATVTTSLLLLPYASIVAGVTLIVFGLWLEQMLIHSYHNSFFYRGLNSILGLQDKTISGATYDVAAAVLKHTDDVTFAFCTSPFGRAALMRAALTEDAVDVFLRGPRQQLTTAMVVLPEKEIFSLIGLGKYLITHDQSFKAMLQQNGVSDETLLRTLRWVVGSYHQEKRRERWWSRDNLSRTTGLGQEWAYGTAYMLERFARDLRSSVVFSTMTTDAAFIKEKVEEIETNLSRSKSANVLIIGEPGVGKMDLVMAVETRLLNGTGLSAVSGKRVVLLDTNRLFAVNKDKQSLEVTLLRMLDEAVHAGNIIIVIENISTFIREAEALGVFVPELLDQYLASPWLHFIGTDTPSAYHTYLEPLGAFARRFAEVLIDTPDLYATTRVLQGIALTTEMKQGVLFTYPGLEAITKAADRYIVEGVMPDKAIELLVDVATKAQQGGTVFITEDFVYHVVSDKTGVPAGPIGAEERDLLLNLEDRLHKQVIGQPRALDAIARTMRRARAGIQSADKPIGSFLFLGPTGVGKTETAKALANIFFGGEHNLARLDMSEFSGSDALVRLIGDGESSGTLADMLREHPYCVLLLDEFEKAARPVHDLFLQILDEGNFNDARGARVNARNCIIIATSNAGSQLIIKTVAQRQELTHLTQSIIDNIIHDGVFRPELINRFDSTIVFEPLTIGEQSQVASIMLGSLYNRIKERGYELTIGKDVVDILVEKGYSAEFGARPMQRAIQDLIEEKVAQKIISGSATRGSTISLSKNDFSEEELAVVL